MRTDSRGCDHRKPSNILRPYYRQVIEVTVGEAGRRARGCCDRTRLPRMARGASDAECW